MRKIYYSALMALSLAPIAAQAQFTFPVQITTNWATTVVQMPPSPLRSQVIFIGGHDSVQTVNNLGQPNGRALAKQWHDFIGFSPATPAEVASFAAAGHQNFMGWVSINHEMVIKNDKIGDGGGMSVFAVKRDPITDTLIVVPQTLPDTRTGRFFNVDFKNTVGETGMNCGGIVGPTGRIWTAEEWLRTSNRSIWQSSNPTVAGQGVQDTSDFTINTNAFAGTDYNGRSIKKFQNFNWMVEIDPRTSKAIRKQYNWGRQEFEGGAILPDNRTVFTGSDATPGFLTKFVADVAGDFTKGKLYAFKHDANHPTNRNWVEIPNTSLDTMLNFATSALMKRATMFNRLEWVAYNKTDGKVYFTETGRDNFGTAFTGGNAARGVLNPHWAKAYKLRWAALNNGQVFSGTDAQALDSVRRSRFNDYYGRVLVYDPITDQVDIHIEGGPFLASSPAQTAYPAKHLSNPDGLSFLHSNGKSFMIINEDLNGTSFGRVPASVGTVCELYLLDMSVANPTINDLVRISATPVGAEVTGAIATPDGKTLLINSQHPATTHPFPYNNSLTYAITGWDRVITSAKPNFKGANDFKIFPNPASREIQFEKATDVAIYDATGKRLKVARNTLIVDVSDMKAGVYFVRNKEGQTLQLVIK